jgi:hypothetical protein
VSALPTFLKTWNTTLINQRIPYVSLIDATESLLYGVKNYLVATMGASVWGSCNGTTGDNTDRWASKANVATRGANTGVANSWAVIAWAGGQLCLSYVGATDDVARISFSQGSLFVLAGTPTFTPTATDEVVIATGITLVGATTSTDRVWSIVATSDRSVFRVCLFRQAAVVESWGMENIVEGPGVTVGTIIGWNSNLNMPTTLVTAGNQAGTNSSSTGGINTFAAWYNGAARQLFGGTVAFNATVATSVFAVPSPELNSGCPSFPVLIGSAAASNTGWLGTRIDMFWTWGNGNNIGDVDDDVSQGTRVIWMPGGYTQPWDSTKGLLLS